MLNCGGVDDGCTACGRDITDSRNINFGFLDYSEYDNHRRKKTLSNTLYRHLEERTGISSGQPSLMPLALLLHFFQQRRQNIVSEEIRLEISS